MTATCCKAGGGSYSFQRVIATGFSHALWYTVVVCSLSWTQNHVSTYGPNFSHLEICALYLS